MSTITTSTLFPFTTPDDAHANRTSLLVPYQLPEFVRDNPNYQNYVLFLQAYYEWMQQEGNTLFSSKGLVDYKDIDNTLDQFVHHFTNEFLSFFPKNSLVDQRKLIKIARELYQTKGTPASFQFLFRILYNSDVNLYNARDYVFRASDGLWVTTRSITLNTIDPSWLQTVNYKVFGQSSKAYATIEDVIISDKNTRIILSNIQGNFLSGEFVNPVDVHSNPILINGNIITSRILGVLSGVTVDKKNPGTSYNVGDPVVFTGGTDPSVQFPVEATGFISKVSDATLRGVTPIDPGHGYRVGSFTQVDLLSNTGVGAKSIVTTLTNNYYDVFLVPNDTIGLKANVTLNAADYTFANLVNANANTKLIEALTFPILDTYGIKEVDVVTTGTGYDGTTIADAVGLYSDDQFQPRALFRLGILPPPTIIDGGQNYSLGDKIVFRGGSGYGAWAIVTNVDVQYGAITEITYISDPSGNTNYPLGGMGYVTGLPTLSVESKTGSGAQIIIPELLGHDAEFVVTSSPYGQIKEITLTNVGENYVNAPKVSLRVQDLLIANTDVLPVKGDLVFQGDYNNPSFYANVDSISTTTINDFYNLRVYDYDGIFTANTDMYLRRGEAIINQNIRVVDQTIDKYTEGRKIYGNGAARAKAIFTNGIHLDSGIYSNQDGHPSAYSIFENKVYNDYTYLLQVEKALSVYKNDVLSFLHPAGLNYTTYNLLKAQGAFSSDVTDQLLASKNLKTILNNELYTADIDPGDPTTIILSNLNGEDISNYVFPNTYITIYTKQGDSFTSLITGTTESTIHFADELINLVPNVAFATVSADSSTINISNLTPAWAITTGNNATFFSDFMHTYDEVSFDGINFNMITHVDEPQYVHGQLIPPQVIKVNNSFGTAQSGYLTFKRNLVTNDIWISSISN